MTRSRACTSWAKIPPMSDPISTTRAARSRICRHLVVQRTSSSPNLLLRRCRASGFRLAEKDGTVDRTPIVRCRMGRAALPLPARLGRTLWIIQDLAQRIGLNWNYRHVSEVFTEMADLMPALANITWSASHARIRPYPVDGRTCRANDVVFDKGFPRPAVSEAGCDQIHRADEMPDAEYSFISPPAASSSTAHGAMTRRATVLMRSSPRQSRRSRAASIASSASRRATIGARLDAAWRGRARVAPGRQHSGRPWCSSRSPTWKRPRTC